MYKLATFMLRANFHACLLGVSLNIGEWTDAKGIVISSYVLCFSLAVEFVREIPLAKQVPNGNGFYFKQRVEKETETK